MLGFSDTSKNDYKKHSSFNAIKSFFSIIVLSAFVLLVVFAIEGLSKFDSSALNGILSKIGITDPRVEQVAGEFITRISDTGVVSNHSLLPSDGGDNVIDGEISSTKTQRENLGNTKSNVLKIAVASDLHFSVEDKAFTTNLGRLSTLLEIISEKGISNLVFLGDVTNFGDFNSLKAASEVFNNSSLATYVLPGDRDQAASVNLDYFIKSFGRHNYVFEIKGYKFLAFDNSANFTPISQDVMAWFKSEVTNADFVFLSQPIYTEGLSWPFNLIYMGSSWETQEDNNLKSKQQEVKSQRDEILGLIRDSDVKAVISGDHHRSSKIEDEEKSGLFHYVVGAVGGNVKEYSQKTLQSERFSILNIYSDDTFELNDTLLNN